MSVAPTEILTGYSPDLMVRRAARRSGYLLGAVAAASCCRAYLAAHGVEAPAEGVAPDRSPPAKARGNVRGHNPMPAEHRFDVQAQGFAGVVGKRGEASKALQLAELRVCDSDQCPVQPVQLTCLAGDNLLQRRYATLQFDTHQFGSSACVATSEDARVGGASPARSADGGPRQ